MQAESAGAQAPAFFARFPIAGTGEENEQMNTSRRAFTAAALAALGAPFVARAQGGDPGSPHKALYLYQGAGREERLLAEGKKEGEVVMYTSLNLKDSVPITEAYEKATGIKVQLWRASSEKVLQRAVAEARAGRHACDIIETNGPEMEAAYREKLLEEFYSPHFRDLPAAAFPKHRHWIADRFNFFTIGYNTDLVKPGEVPKAYEDLLLPRWAGRVGIEGGDVDWFAAMVKLMGEEKGLAFFRKLADSRPQIRTGHTLMGELVASGEIPLAATIYNHNIERLAIKGAPVQWKALNPTFGRPNAIGVARNAPHPHAAMTFADFMLSKEGQTLIRDRNRVPASLSVETRLNKFPFHMIDPVITLDENDRWEKLWIELFLKGRKVQKEAE
jgi:iron(III) transport system substrate-binding protein